MNGKGGSGPNISDLLTTISESVNKRKIINEHIGECIKEILPDILQYLDTPRDKQVVKGLLAEVTSVKFTAELQGIESRFGTTNAKQKLKSNLQHYKEICVTSQIVRNYLTNKQQHRLTKRIIEARKAKELRIIAALRGRKLKSEEFPGLAAAMEYAFGECDLAQGGGGLESHP